MSDQKNLILAAILSFLVIGLWEVFIVSPQREEARRMAEIEAQRQSEAGEVVSPQTQGPGAIEGPAGALMDRSAALEAGARVPFDTPSIDGSIALTGGRIDDLNLKDYRVSLEEDSPEVTVLSPRGAEDAYYALFGWSGANAGPLPGPRTEWRLAEGDRLAPGSPVTLEWDNGAGLTFRQTYSVDENYMFTVDQSVENATGEPVTLAPYGIVARHGLPDTLGFYLVHEGAIGAFDGVTREVDYDDIDDLDLDPAERAPVEKVAVEQNGWIGFTDKFWMTALIPGPGQGFTAAFKRGGGVEPVYQTDARLPARSVADGATASAQIRLFAGAKQADVLSAYETDLQIDRFYDAIDWGWFWFLTKPFFFVLNAIYKLVGNFGVAIILLTVLVKAVMFPLAYKSYVSMGRMKQLQPETEKIRERYKEDPQQMQRAMLELYKREKVNPASGCLPILLQIPVFFALYKVLFVTLEMRHAPFFGWIQDLSAPDPLSIFTLFGLLDWNPPTLMMIGIWPLIMGVTMWLQQQLNPAPADPMQKKIFAWLPVVFTFMLGSFPAGLVIYWTANNVLTIIQQASIMRSQGVKIELWDNLKSLFSRKKRES